ncbi:MAG: hypothetical protein V4722_00505 [Bacteroidota bacterium]
MGKLPVNAYRLTRYRWVGLFAKTRPRSPIMAGAAPGNQRPGLAFSSKILKTRWHNY